MGNVESSSSSAGSPTTAIVSIKPDPPSDIERIQEHLRQKYLNDIDVVQRRVAEDPESWSSDQLTGAEREIKELQKLLKATEFLTLQDCSDDDQADVTCPICMEEMTKPRKIYTCSNGHPICSICKTGSSKALRACPVCRDSFEQNPPKRNVYAERLVGAIVTMKHRM